VSSEQPGDHCKRERTSRSNIGGTGVETVRGVRTPSTGPRDLQERTQDKNSERVNLQKTKLKKRKEYIPVLSAIHTKRGIKISLRSAAFY